MLFSYFDHIIYRIQNFFIISLKLLQLRSRLLALYSNSNCIEDPVAQNLPLMEAVHPAVTLNLETN
jgi:hypothetical protein